MKIQQPSSVPHCATVDNEINILALCKRKLMRHFQIVITKSIVINMNDMIITDIVEVVCIYFKPLINYEVLDVPLIRMTLG